MCLHINGIERYELQSDSVCGPCLLQRAAYFFMRHCYGCFEVAWLVIILCVVIIIIVIIGWSMLRYLIVSVSPCVCMCL